MNIVAYYRVSTKKQGQSGLGLEAQTAALTAFEGQCGGRIVAEYKEVESGKNSARVELAKAVAHAKRSRAKLVVAKLDRLSRNVAFLSTLLESKVDFCACDNPHANKLTIHILAAVAEQEAEAISQRTKAALQAAKARGVKLGSARKGHWEGREDARQRGAARGAKVARKARVLAADAAYADLYPIVSDLRKAGQSYQQIADRLNEMGHSTRRGKRWNASQVLRVTRRAVAT